MIYIYICDIHTDCLLSNLRPTAPKIRPRLTRGQTESHGYRRTTLGPTAPWGWSRWYVTMKQKGMDGVSNWTLLVARWSETTQSIKGWCFLGNIRFGRFDLYGTQQKYDNHLEWSIAKSFDRPNISESLYIFHWDADHSGFRCEKTMSSPSKASVWLLEIWVVTLPSWECWGLELCGGPNAFFQVHYGNHYEPCEFIQEFHDVSCSLLSHGER